MKKILKITTNISLMIVPTTLSISCAGDVNFTPSSKFSERLPIIFTFKEDFDELTEERVLEFILEDVMLKPEEKKGISIFPGSLKKTNEPNRATAKIIVSSENPVFDPEAIDILIRFNEEIIES